MAVSPKDLVLNADELRRIEKYEETIDRALRECYGPGGLSISINLSSLGTIPAREVSELVRRYKAAGWANVERDLYRWTFTARAE